MDALLLGLDDLLLAVFGVATLICGVLMLVLRAPMQVATALISAMVFLGGIYGLTGAHFLAAFQVLIYVGAVMVFMVYVIMLLDARDASMRHRYSRWFAGGVVVFSLFVLGAACLVAGGVTSPGSAGPVSFGLRQFAQTFITEYWLQFELTSVLLLAAVVAAIALMKGSRRG